MGLLNEHARSLDVGEGNKTKAEKFIRQEADEQLLILYVTILAMRKSQAKVTTYMTDRWAPTDQFKKWLDKQCDQYFDDPHTQVYTPDHKVQLPALVERWMKRGPGMENEEWEDPSKVKVVRNIAKSKMTLKRYAIKQCIQNVSWISYDL